jgi:hypothetical protein
MVRTREHYGYWGGTSTVTVSMSSATLTIPLTIWLDLRGKPPESGARRELSGTPRDLGPWAPGNYAVSSARGTWLSLASLTVQQESSDGLPFTVSWLQSVMPLQIKRERYATRKIPSRVALLRWRRKCVSELDYVRFLRRNTKPKASKPEPSIIEVIGSGAGLVTMDTIVKLLVAFVRVAVAFEAWTMILSVTLNV